MYKSLFCSSVFTEITSRFTGYKTLFLENFASITKTQLTVIKVFTFSNSVCTIGTRHLICFRQYHCNLFFSQTLKHFRTDSFHNSASSHSLRLGTNAFKLDWTNSASAFYHNFRGKLHFSFSTETKKTQKSSSLKFSEHKEFISFFV